MSLLFFFNDTATTELYTLSLHDALPILSTYIHPMSDDYLLTIGIPPANEDGTGLDWSSVQVSQFNVSNLSSPTLVNKQLLSPVDEDDGDYSWNWGWSEATYEHKAFQYWAPKGMLAVPMSTYTYDYASVNGQDYSRYIYVSQLMLINAVPGENLSIHGTIDHSDFYNNYENYYWGQSSIRRTIFMGDFVYAISAAGVTAHNLTTLNETASVQIWKPEFDSWYNNYYEVDGEEATGDDGTTSSEADPTDPPDSEGESSGSDGSTGSGETGGGTDGDDGIDESND